MTLRSIWQSQQYRTWTGVARVLEYRSDGHQRSHPARLSGGFKSWKTFAERYLFHALEDTMSKTDLPAREAMEFDVVIVGAGPAGLAAAIRLKQLNPDLGVVVVEKGSEVGAHILSGAVIDPIGLDRLLPGWREEDTPIKTPVTEDRFYWLGPAGGLRLPAMFMPPLLNNHRNFIVSLGNVCR